MRRFGEWVLEPGRKLGPYALEAKVAAGGMGEVYRARDTRLDRTVAVKVLPAGLSQHEAIRERFEREARAVAALTHPNICALYDVGEQDGVRFLVLEYVRGDTLERVLARHRGRGLPLVEVMRIAVQVAQALDAAHQQNIVHRDLKPANIMITEAGAKLLDFGLAKFYRIASTDTVRVDASSLAPLATEQGALLGTPGYAAPEQLRGATVDPRTDVFAFGALVYEMVTGVRAFGGENRAAVMSAILHDEPVPASTRSPQVSPALDALIAGCLAKDPEERWQSMRDVARQLARLQRRGDHAGLTSATAAQPRGRRLLFPASMLGAVVVAIASRGLWSSGGAPGRAFNLDLVVDELRHGLELAVAPDGRQVVFSSGAGDGVARLWARPLDAPLPRPLPGTEDGRSPFWSPDGRSIAFVARRELKVVDLGSGRTRTLCEAPGHVLGGSWSATGDIVLALAPGGLYRIDAKSGMKTPALRAPPPDGYFARPAWMNDEAFVYLDLSPSQKKHGLYRADREGNVLGFVAESATGALLTHDRLLTVRNKTLFAHRFDAVAARITSPPVAVVDRIECAEPVGLCSVSASRDNVIVFRQERLARATLTWFDRDGRPRGIVGVPGQPQREFAVARDGSSVLSVRLEPGTLQLELWELDTRSNAARRVPVTLEHGLGSPVWEGVGRGYLFASSGAVDTNVYRSETPGGVPRPYAHISTRAYLTDASDDGRYLAFESFAANRILTGYVLDVSRPIAPFDVTASGRVAGEARLSRDGRWVAYTLGKAGEQEVFIARNPAASGDRERREFRITPGSQPRWKGDGSALFVLAPDQSLLSIPFDGHAPDAPPRPVRLFRIPGVPPGETIAYDVTSDGERFLVRVPEAERGLMKVLVGWDEAAVR